MSTIQQTAALSKLNEARLAFAVALAKAATTRKFPKVIGDTENNINLSSLTAAGFVARMLEMDLVDVKILVGDDKVFDVPCNWLTEEMSSKDGEKQERLFIHLAYLKNAIINAEKELPSSAALSDSTNTLNRKNPAKSDISSQIQQKRRKQNANLFDFENELKTFINQNNVIEVYKLLLKLGKVDLDKKMLVGDAKEVVKYVKELRKMEGNNWVDVSVKAKELFNKWRMIVKA